MYSGDAAMTVSLNQFLMLYSWFLAAGLLLFVLLIGRFFRRFSGVRVWHRLYLLPLVLMGMATVRYTSVGMMAGDIWGDLFSALGGSMLIALSALLWRRMLSRRAHLDSADSPASK
ncbi:MAG: hypothetical protein HXY40_14100 [Chloroflexi bacterium]|nr:hypothetical protein [Chloroflexota bacterium]